jgi:methionyl-tRNA formyltransferase
VRIVFFGTPEFAVPSLRALVGEGFDVAAVVTQPDRPQGRSRSRLVPPPVKSAALEEGIPVLQPERPGDAAFINELGKLEPALGVVAAYGHILRQALLDVPTQGMLNVHASLLPALRGAAPIEHAILGGLEETGVSIMRVVLKMDAGPVVHRVATPIAADETGGELTVRLAEIGALALVEALAMLEMGEATPIAQDETLVTFAPKVTHEAARIPWNQPAERVARVVRAFDPRPGAWTTHAGREIKLFGPRPADEWERHDVPGRIIATDPALAVATGDGALQFLDVQPAGRARMAARDWLRGRGASRGDCFE